MNVINKWLREDNFEKGAPRHDTADLQERAHPRFYLVGEEQRAAIPAVAVNGRTTILINGTYHSFRGRTASYLQILRIAFPNAPLHSPGSATISYHGGRAPRPCGFLQMNDVIDLVETLKINADATNAS